jgi:hypothetical protein
MRTVGEIVRAAADVVRGEAERVAAGGTPLAQPSAAEIAEWLEQLEGEMKRRKQIMVTLDRISSAVMEMREEVDELILDLWDELDFAYRRDEAPAKRRRLREWGVVYETRTRRAEVTKEARIPVLDG